jgi:GNAT superfamily N-acetyltransferase
LRIAYLADHPEAIPTLARWFQEESPDYFAGWTAEELEQHFQPWLHRDRLPLGLVAFEQGEVVGCIVLREKALDREPAHSPGLGGLHVAERHRGRGIGSALVKAGMDAARALGYEVVYTGTGTAGGILERLGWEPMESLTYHGYPVVLYRCAV